MVMEYTLGPILIFYEEDYARTEGCSWTATAEIRIWYLSGRKNPEEITESFPSAQDNFPAQYS